MTFLKKMTCTAVAFAVITAGESRAATYPSQPIKVVVPYSPGGTADIVARVLADKVGAILGQAMIIENRSGADGTIGAQFAARAKPDGYTLLQVASGSVILPSLRQDVGYDWKHSFTPFFGVTGVPEVVAVNGSSNIHSLADLAKLAQSSPGGINYGSGGTGSMSHLTSALLVQALKAPATHIPYRGLSDMLAAVLGNQVQFAVDNINDAIPLANSGQLRLLAVTSPQRLASLPDVPTLAEQGLADSNIVSWTADLAPAGTPPAILDRLHDAFDKAATDPDVKERLGKLGVVITVMSTSEVGDFMQKEAGRWQKVIEDNHIKLQD